MGSLEAHNVTNCSRAQELRAEGTRVAVSPYDAALHADVLITYCLTTKWWKVSSSALVARHAKKGSARFMVSGRGLYTSR